MANRGSQSRRHATEQSQFTHEPLFGSPLDFQSEPNKPVVVTAADGLLGNAAALKDADTYRVAVQKTLLSVGAATLFGACTWLFKGQQSGMEFFAGYLVEQSLSIDNLFVFIMLFSYFKVPQQFQARVLKWGILGAVLMRGVMIALGVAVVKQFRWIILLFAAILLLSSWKLLQEEDDESDLSNNAVVKVARKLVGAVDEYDGDRFFTRETGGGARVATPLLLCLVCIELSDFVFAVDSIPAVLGVSHDPFVVYSSNIFAIMGLRSAYTIVSKAIDQLPYLKPSVALVLGFVGAKMIFEFFQFEISTGLSLAVVILLIGGGVALSLLKKTWHGAKRKNSDTAILEAAADGELSAV